MDLNDSTYGNLFAVVLEMTPVLKELECVEAVVVVEEEPATLCHEIDARVEDDI